jgi:cytoskeletal protein RodZ
MQSLGQRLRAERESRGLTIDQLAQKTRINPSYFEAIENDDPARIPGGFFYRSFLRQYARLLELPESEYSGEIVRSLDADRAAMDAAESVLPEQQITVPPMPTGRINRSVEFRRLAVRLAALAGVVVVCGAAYSAYMRWGASLVSRSMASLSSPAKAPASAASAPVASSPTPEQAAPAVQSAEASGALVQAEGSSASQYAIQLVLRALEDTWVQVAQNDQRVFSGILRSGESRVFEGTERLRLKLGNAGGVEIEWNGKPVPAMGPKGQVRVVDFTTAEYSVIPPKRLPANQPSL